MFYYKNFFSFPAFALSFLLSIQALFAQGIISKAEAVRHSQQIAHAQFPDADTIVTDDYQKIVYQQDGTSETLYDTYEKVLTEKGKREKRIFSQSYTAQYSKVKIELVEIIKPDGRCVEIDLNKNSREMTDRNQMSSNIYDPNSKLLEVSVPGIEIGDTLHTVTKETLFKTRVPDTWSEYSVFQGASPIIKSVLEIEGPDKLPLVNMKLRDEVKDKVKFVSEKKDGRISYKWTVENVPRFFEEPNMPPYWTVVQRLLVSTIQDWNYLSKWYWKLCKPRLEATTPEMKEKVKELTKGITDRQKKIEAIFRFVAQKIRYMGITTEDVAPGYEPHDVKITFENRYGVCRDKAALLAAMLRLSGFTAYPVLISVGPKKDAEVPNPYFNHAITCVENDDGTYMLMDSTDENATELFPADLCDKSYLVAKPEGDVLRTSPIIPAEKNLMIIETKGKIGQDDKLSAETTLNFEGMNDSIYRGFFSKMKQEERRLFFEGKIKDIISGAKLADIKFTPDDMMDISKPLSIKFSYTADNFLVRGDSELMLSPPWLGFSFGLVNFLIGKTGLEKRNYPFLTYVACGVRESFELNTEYPSLKALSLPKFTNINSDEILWKEELKQYNKSIKGQSEFLIKVVEFNPEQYLSLKKALREIENDKKRMAIFDNPRQKADYSAKDTDAVLIDENIEITVLDQNTWNSRRSVKKQILTFSGKKKNSEIKINYNPVWENVHISKAIVTDAKGNKKQLDSKELNIMDAAWVASAPRYPPGKTLVASLPGVDIGSIVEYTIERSFKDKPFFSIIEYFRYSEPVVSKKVRLLIPEKLEASFYIPPGMKSNSNKEKKDGNTIYTWTASEQKAVKMEDDMPPWWSFNPSVFVSTGKVITFAELTNKLLKRASADQKKTAETAHEITKDISDEKQKIINIRNYIAENIREAGPDINELPMSCISPADKTLADRYGNNQDIAVLFYSMLRETGFRPEFVIASNYPNLKPVFSNLTNYLQPFVFDTVLLRVKTKEGFIYLNDSNQYSKAGATYHSGKPALVLDSGKIEEITPLPGMENKTELTFDIKLDSHGNAEIKETHLYCGVKYGEFHKRFAEMLPEKLKRYYQEALAEISQSAKPLGNLVTDFNSYPGIEQICASVPDFAVRENNFMYLKLPGDILGNIIKVSVENRHLPYYKNRTVNRVLNYNISLPENIRDVKICPSSFEWTAPSGSGYIKLDSKIGLDDKQGKILGISCEIKLSPMYLNQDEYKELLEINRKLSHPEMQVILLEENK